VTEDDYSVMPSSAVPADLLAHLEPESMPALPPPVVHLVSSNATSAIHLPVVNLDKAELDVFSTLHRLKADLGEPVTVTRSDEAVKVGIWQLPVDRQRELRAAFSGEEGVEVELTAPHAPIKKPVIVKTGDTPSHVEVLSGTASPDDERLLRYFGSPEREQDFTNEALGTSTAILAHLYALRELQTQFPAERTPSLAPEDLEKLHSLVQDHVTAVSANIDALARQLAPLDAAFKMPPCAQSTAVGTNWQSGSVQALGIGRQLDSVLRSVFTISQTPAAPNEALPELNQDLCNLKTGLSSID
jgi:hypothetical protein